MLICLLQANSLRRNPTDKHFTQNPTVPLELPSPFPGYPFLAPLSNAQQNMRGLL